MANHDARICDPVGWITRNSRQTLLLACATWQRPKPCLGQALIATRLPLSRRWAIAILLASLRVAQAWSPGDRPIQLLKLARSGDAVFERTIAEDFLHGPDVRKENAQALEWFRPARDQDDPEALNGLGALDGGGAKLRFDVKDRKGLGCGYFSQAAGKGYGPALVEVAGCFRDGRLSGRQSERKTKAAVG